MKVFLTGGTGFIGQHLTRFLVEQSHSVVVATRYPEQFNRASGKVEAQEPDDQQNATVRYVPLREDMTADIEGSRVVINLAGESLFGKRWTSSVKKRLYNSRIQTTNALVSGMQRLDSIPELFLSTSGINYYGDSGEDEVTEERGRGDDFLARLCHDWESAALEARKYGIRVVTPRTGVVLGAGGGALATMLPVFRGYLGGSIGPGTQYFPWIHMEDHCRALLHAIVHDEIEGAYNAVAPNPVTMDDFAASLGSVLSRPSMFKVPEQVVNLALGEAAVLLTSSLKAVPEVLRNKGFKFRFPDVGKALENLLSPG